MSKATPLQRLGIEGAILQGGRLVLPGKDADVPTICTPAQTKRFLADPERFGPLIAG